MSFSLKGSQPWSSGFDTTAQVLTNGEPISVQKIDQLQVVIDNITSIKHGNIYAEEQPCAPFFLWIIMMFSKCAFSCALFHSEEYNQQVSAALDFNNKLKKSLRNAELKTGFYTDRKDITEQLKEVARLISTRNLLALRLL